MSDGEEKGPVIAVDGPAASGKGTIARALAGHFGLPHMDTGLLYRAVALNLWRWGGDPASEFEALRACDDARLRSRTTRNCEASRCRKIASMISAYPSVRAALLERQQEFAAQAGRRRARRPRHRHRDRARRRREAVRHRVARSSRRAARSSELRERGMTGALSKMCSPTSARATNATPGAPSRRSSPRPTRCCSTPANSIRRRRSPRRCGSSSERLAHGA